eukprot:1158278-Pelagomonas_calceolata.AAC.8
MEPETMCEGVKKTLSILNCSCLQHLGQREGKERCTGHENLSLRASTPAMNVKPLTESKKPPPVHRPRMLRFLRVSALQVHTCCSDPGGDGRHNPYMVSRHKTCMQVISCEPDGSDAWRVSRACEIIKEGGVRVVVYRRKGGVCSVVQVHDETKIAPLVLTCPEVVKEGGVRRLQGLQGFTREEAGNVEVQVHDDTNITPLVPLYPAGNMFKLERYKEGLLGLYYG